MHIFLTGVAGLAGSAFARAAKRRGHTITGVIHKTPPPDDLPIDNTLEGDLTDRNWVFQTVLDRFPDALVNAAAISEAGECEANPETSQSLNVDLPAHLAQLAHHLSALFLHLSTDMVFDGERGNYSPADSPSPPNLYGWQKTEAEKAVLKQAPSFALVLRLSLLNGNSTTGRRSAHEKLFASWAGGETARLYTDEIRQPCLAENAAEVMVELCERNDLLGIHHWAGAERLSRWDFGRKIVRHFNLPESLIEPASRLDYKQGRQRPANLTFDLSGLRTKLKTRPQTVEEQLESLVVPPPAREWFHSL